MTDYVICFIKASELHEKDYRIPGECIDAVYKVQSTDSDKAKLKAIELFHEDNPEENANDYITSIGWGS